MKRSMKMNRMSPMRALAIVEGLEQHGNEGEFIMAMQYLVDTGMAWTLPGRIGRAASSMLDAGILDAPMVYPGSKVKNG
jgi:hypothetical protein